MWDGDRVSTFALVGAKTHGDAGVDSTAADGGVSL